MPLFNKKIIQKHLKAQEIPSAHLAILQNWQKRIFSRDLEKQSEVALQGVFMQNLLVEVLGYQAFGENSSYTVAKEYPIAGGAVDLALGQFCNDKQGDIVHAVFELKGAKTKNLDAIMSGRTKSPVQQAWEYAVNCKGCQWVLVSNYVELRLYAFGYTKFVYESFELAKLTERDEYARFMLCLQADNLLGGGTKQLLEQSQQAEKEITAQLYADYKNLREQLITQLMQDNPEIAPLELISPAQKLLDRILFVAFAEDKGLIPDKSIEKAYKFTNPYEDPKPKYQTFKSLFNAINKGRKELDIKEYNGGLFAPDKLLDRLIVADEICKGFLQIAEYDFDSEVSITVLGHIFEQSIADLEEITAQIQQDGQLKPGAKTGSVTGKRKQHGIVYTPDHITAFIVEHTLSDYLQQRFDACLSGFGHIEGDKIVWNSMTASHKPAKKLSETDAELNFLSAWQAMLKTIKIVDPACGSGAFLVAAFDVLHAEYQRINHRISELSGQPDIFSLHSDLLNKEILSSNLSGVDVNPESIEITKLSLWLKTAERGKKLATIGQHLQVGNSLGFDSAVNQDSFCWQANFSKIMQSGGFDVVLGNPPYVRQELLSDVKPYLQTNYAVYHGVADLYAYFFELGLKLLKPNGMLGFISSSTFFKTGSGEPLRKFLTENATLKKVVDFGDLQVFEGVTTYPAILIFQNAKPEADSEIQTLLLKKELPEKLSEFFKENHGVMAHSQLRAESWQLENARLNQLRDKLTRGYPTLKEVYGSPLYGIKTGLNEAFVIDGTIKDKLIQQDPKSAELLKPFLEGKDLKKWHSEPRDLWLILMPKGWTQEKTGELLDEPQSWDWLKNNYSAIAQWLEPFADAARKRTDKGDFWWELRACAYYDKFENPKIVYPDLSQGSKFHIDEKTSLFPNTAYFIESTDEFLLGLLNSKTVWFFLEGISDAMRGGEWRIRMFSQNIERIPIPPATDEQKSHVGQLAEQCQTLSEARYKLEKDTQLSIAELGVKKLTRKLENAWDLEFKDFLEELAKNKVQLPVKKHSEWRDFMSEIKKQHQDFNLQIAALELQLNNAVYQLFDLTAEEINLIEMN